jgi:hypothetical protein
MENESVNLKALQSEIEGLESWLVKVRGVSYAGAGTLVMGHAIKILNRNDVTCKEVINLLESTIKIKRLEELSEDEIQLLLAAGFITKKKKPFLAAAGKVGRNEPCPCNSGRKYKLCCLDEFQRQDKLRYLNG